MNKTFRIKAFFLKNEVIIFLFLNKNTVVVYIYATPFMFDLTVKW